MHTHIYRGCMGNIANTEFQDKRDARIDRANITVKHGGE